MQDIQQLVAEHGKVIYGLCRRLTGNAFDADDLYQQTFLTALGKDFREDGNARAFLTKICVAQWKNEERKRARHHRIAPETDIELEEPVLPDGEPSAELEKREQAQAVRRLVDALDERHRTPVVLYYQMELPLEEIAQIIGCPVGTVKSRLSAARAKIRQGLEESGYDG